MSTVVLSQAWVCLRKDMSGKFSVGLEEGGGRVRGMEYLKNDKEQERLKETLKVMAMKRLVSPAGEYD